MLPIPDNLPRNSCGEAVLPATRASRSPLAEKFSPTGREVDFGEYVVDQDPPFDPAKAIITSA